MAQTPDTDLLTALYDAYIPDSIFSIEATAEVFNLLLPLLAASARPLPEILSNIATARRCIEQLEKLRSEVVEKIRTTAPDPEIFIEFDKVNGKDPVALTEAIGTYTRILLSHHRAIAGNLVLMSSMSAANDCRKTLLSMRASLVTTTVKRASIVVPVLETQQHGPMPAKSKNKNKKKNKRKRKLDEDSQPVPMPVDPDQLRVAVPNKRKLSEDEEEPKPKKQRYRQKMPVLDKNGQPVLNTSGQVLLTRYRKRQKGGPAGADKLGGCG